MKKRINSSVVNCYREPAFSSEVVTQAIYNETVEVLEQKEDWYRIRQSDGYESWVYYFFVVDDLPVPTTKNWIVSEMVNMIYGDEGLTSPVTEVVLGTYLSLLSEFHGIAKLVLPDGSIGYIKGRRAVVPDNPTRKMILRTARRFLGIQYLWGGKSTKGVDCSGFVQTVFRLNGIHLPRDAWQQERFLTESVSMEQSLPGDLVFFSENQKISHVGIVSGNDEIIHASGRVRIDSFRGTAGNFNKRLKDSFSVIKTIGKLLK